MMSYELSILTAIGIFPFIAGLITLPYFIYNYHKYGSISKFRIMLVYSFILYLMCAYFLIVLPLPEWDYVKKLTTPRTQLIFGKALADFIIKSGFDITNIHTYISAIKTSYFYQPIFNVLLTVPFGMYLHYYHKFSLKKTVIFSFLLSLFFELTQLSGIYFIYPRSYRLFDVDDLFLNTMGGLLGYFISSLLMKKLPSRDKIDSDTISKAYKVTGLRRIFTFIFNYMIGLSILALIMVIMVIVHGDTDVYFLEKIYMIIMTILFLIIPIIFKRTFGEMITNLKIDGKTIYRIFRTILLYFIIFVVPILIAWLTNKNSMYGLLLFMSYFILITVTFFKLVFNKEIWYDKVTKTKCVNTLKVEEK